MPNYTEQNIEHISLQIAQCREAIPNNSMKVNSNNNEDSAAKRGKIPPELKTGLRAIHLMTIQ
jgi:hypothetical protein